MKKLRFSTFAQVLIVLLCAAMIWTGLYVLDTRANVVWDLTPDLLTELSEGTIQTMDGLDESVHLHLVFKAETESDLRWMLETLAGKSSLVTDRRMLLPLLDMALRVYHGAHTFDALNMAAYTPQEDKG